MEDTVITLANYQADLSSRAVVRDVTVAIPCQGADRASGILVAEHGKPWLKQHAAVIDLTERTRATILLAISERLHLNPAA